MSNDKQLDIDVKDLLVKPIAASTANAICKKLHYSGSVVPNSQLHFGVFYKDMILGVMQFGPCMSKKRMLGLVNGLGWNQFIELNRMAFDNRLPKNSESRCIGVALRIIKKKYPHIGMVISFADGSQCGDGTIYRATGFYLTQIKPNKQMVKFKNGDVVARFSLEAHVSVGNKYGKNPKETFHDFLKRVGAVTIPGFQLRYIKFLDPELDKKKNFTPIPFSEIARVGATMYKGNRAVSTNRASPDQGEGGGLESDLCAPLDTCDEQLL